LRAFYINHMDDIDSYYWIENGHHNTHGYEMMSDGILNAIHQNGFLNNGSLCAE
jgi:hypothetical protein